MAGSKIRANDPTTWTAERIRGHLQCGTMNDTFYKNMFDWNDAKLQEAFRRANDALQRAGIKPSEILSRIRLVKGTEEWTTGAYKRLVAEAELVTESFDTDKLFCLPHERNSTPPPSWFRETMMYAGRQPRTIYTFPTITQKFFQHARDTAKAEAKQHETARANQAAELESPSPVSPGTPHHASNWSVPPADGNNGVAGASGFDAGTPRSPPGDAHWTELFEEDTRQSKPQLDQADFDARTPRSPGDAEHWSEVVEEPTRHTRPQLDHADVHVGWIVQQDDGSIVLEKDFRSLRTWLDGSERWNYNYEAIRKSLRMTEDRELQLFWFEDLAGEPWSVKDDHAVAGAIERMHRKGEICFLLARNIEHVRALTITQRGECHTPSKP